MQRILLKLSGEALAGDKKTGFDEPTVRKVALQVKELVDDGIHNIDCNIPGFGAMSLKSEYVKKA